MHSCKVAAGVHGQFVNSEAFPGQIARVTAQLVARPFLGAGWAAALSPEVLSLSWLSLSARASFFVLLLRGSHAPCAPRSAPGAASAAPNFLVAHSQRTTPHVCASARIEDGTAVLVWAHVELEVGHRSHVETLLEQVHAPVSLHVCKRFSACCGPGATLANRTSRFAIGAARTSCHNATRRNRSSRS